METYRRKIVKDISGDFIVLKPEGDDFHSVVEKYDRRGLYNCLKNLRVQRIKKQISGIEIIVDSSISGSGDMSFDNIEKLLKYLDSKKSEVAV